MSARQRVAVVTGGGGGIGAAIAEELGRAGWFVVVVDPLTTLDGSERLPEPEETTAGRIVAGGGSARASSISVTDADAVRELFAELGRVDAVVNVAGITRDARIPKKSFDDFKLVLAVHLHGTFLFTREVAAQHWHVLFKNGGNQPLADGANRFIVNFSSVSARNGNVGQVDYTAAKGAIESLTKTTAREFSGYRARVNAVANAVSTAPSLCSHRRQRPLTRPPVRKELHDSKRLPFSLEPKHPDEKVVVHRPTAVNQGVTHEPFLQDQVEQHLPSCS